MDEVRVCSRTAEGEGNGGRECRAINEATIFSGVLNAKVEFGLRTRFCVDVMIGRKFTER